MSNRREMVRGALRVAGLGAVAALAAVLGVRGVRNGACRREAAGCGGCPWQAGCGLPEARAHRAGRARPGEGGADRE